MVSDELDDMKLKITDFGYSCFIDNKKGLKLALGTPDYIAPEVLNQNNYNHKCDIWSIGIITYVLLTNETPFKKYEDI